MGLLDEVLKEVGGAGGTTDPSHHTLAAKAGISPEMASSAIAQILPHLVDKSTPNGQIPSAGGLIDVISGVFRKAWLTASSVARR